MPKIRDLGISGIPGMMLAATDQCPPEEPPGPPPCEEPTFDQTPNCVRKTSGLSSDVVAELKQLLNQQLHV